MGRRSRKRATEPGPPAGVGRDARRARRGASRARPQARSGGGAGPARRPRPGRTSIDDRPPPLWGSFPLTELIILAGIVLMVWGFASGSGREGDAKIAAGLGIAALAGLELAVREHVTGFRSHSTLLAGAAAIATVAVLSAGVGLDALAVAAGRWRAGVRRGVLRSPGAVQAPLRGLGFR